MKKIKLFFSALLSLLYSVGYCQMVEVLGELKVTNVAEASYSNDILVLDGINVISKRNANTLGVPSTGIIMSLIENNLSLINAGFVNIGKYSIPFEQLLPTGSFTNTSTINAPVGMTGHSAIWTGDEMIVWSGQNSLGASYNPATDSWTAINAIGAPSTRNNQTTIWTGTEMIIWGGGEPGSPGYNTGAKYNPTTDTWTVTALTNAPIGRDYHTAVWTGTEMIVWGGRTNGVFTPTNTGAKYNPATNSWVAISTINAPGGTYGHSAIWTGTEMIVHGGITGSINKKYNPVTDTWSDIAINNTTRCFHSAVWTGSQMIVWGGTGVLGGSVLNSGSRYIPATNTWQATTLTNVPSARFLQSAVWTGTEMIIWGGSSASNGTTKLNTGAKYNPVANSWITMPVSNAPGARISHTGVWTGQKKIIFGGTEDGGTVNTGAIYNPLTGTYTSASPVDIYLFRKN